MAKYIYQHKDWTNFTWNDSAINNIFGEVRHLQGEISGYMKAIGFSTKEEATLSTLTLDVVKSSEIEGEYLNYQQVRSSIARRLGIETAGLSIVNKNVEGIVNMMLDATQNFRNSLTEDRLFSWHSALFPSGYSEMHKIEVARYRTGEMQVVSGAMGKEKIHYQAINPKNVKSEMNKFLNWFNHNNTIDPVFKAAIAHFWFIIIHPFDDGNGRIARAISDMLLARSESNSERFYSMSNQILLERTRYYEVLQKVQHSSGDITEWINWFLHCMKKALMQTEGTLNNILHKAEFWKVHENTPINERQRLVLNKLLDGFDGKLKTSKWAKISKCSQDTAIRDINDLINKNILKKDDAGGRSTNYELV